MLWFIRGKDKGSQGGEPGEKMKRFMTGKTKKLNRGYGLIGTRQ